LVCRRLEQHNEQQAVIEPVANANRCLCCGVNLRWCEGFICSAQSSSADDVLGHEWPAFDVVGESSCGIGERS
jgi:hypothetical protein